MDIQDHLVNRHFRETEKFLRAIEKKRVSRWLLLHGYFPESNILPPTFFATNFELKSKPYNKNLNDLKRRNLRSISYPKSLLASRVFSVQHPWNYHDIVWYLNRNWNKILDILFPSYLKIFSYSLPIPITKNRKKKLSNLRAGRMIYEWITMAEKDLIQDSSFYKVIARTDISNFYPSIYTHSIAWAIHGREEAFADNKFKLIGNKIDRLTQYANDAKTNGIPIGSALSDLISEIVLTWVDKRVSERTEEISYVGVRFKDDYRILCHSDDDAKTILTELSKVLNEINLNLNENKTHIDFLPDGLYRAHDREYFPHSLKEVKLISFKKFEHTLLIALDIHRKYSGTSILEKFLSELLDGNNGLKVEFAQNDAKLISQLKKFISLLFLLKRESEKILSQVLAFVELIYLGHLDLKDDLKPFIKEIILFELKSANLKASAFEIAWYIFFSRYICLGISDFHGLITNNSIRENPFVQSLITSQNKLFKEDTLEMQLFRKPRDCKGRSLVDRLDVFQKNS